MEGDAIQAGEIFSLFQLNFYLYSAKSKQQLPQGDVVKARFLLGKAIWNQ